MQDYFFDESLVPMYIINLSTGQILLANNAALVQYDYNKEEFLALSLDQLMKEEDLIKLQHEHQTGQSASLDFGKARHYKKGGEVISVHIYAYPVNHFSTNSKLIMAIQIPASLK